MDALTPPWTLERGDAEAALFVVVRVCEEGGAEGGVWAAEGWADWGVWLLDFRLLPPRKLRRELMPPVAELGQCAKSGCVLWERARCFAYVPLFLGREGSGWVGMGFIFEVPCKGVSGVGGGDWQREWVGGSERGRDGASCSVQPALAKCVLQIGTNTGPGRVSGRRRRARPDT